MQPQAPAQAAPPEWARDLLRQADAARRGGRHALALAIYRRLVAAAPQLAVAHQHLAALLTVMDQVEEAEIIARRELARAPRDPLLRHTMAQILMKQGRYPEAWPYYEARHEVAALGLPKPDLACPEWRGEDLAGKRIVVFPEMGFGDQMQFARFAPELAARGAEAILLAPPALARLFAESFPDLRVIEASGQVDFPDPDFWTLMTALVGRLGVTLGEVWRGPYLRAPQRQVAPRAPGFRIGLMTEGNPSYKNDAVRSLGPADAGWLAQALPGEVVSLAPAQSGARNFADTAALIETLDLVVSVDTAVIHLAGGMGKPGLLLLPGVATDWRWLRDRDDSPWYPSLRLHRAEADGGWRAAMERLVEDARGRAAAKGEAR